MNKKLLTKSMFLEFLQCPERLRKSLFGPKEIDDETKQILQNGNEVGLLARELFPDGFEVGASIMYDNRFKDLVIPGSVYFEAPFKTDDLLARADIISVLPNGTLKLSEVKSTTSFKESEHLPDIYFQKKVIEEATGLKVSELELIHVNSSYVFDGTWEVQKYFTVVKVPFEKRIQRNIEKKITECLESLRNDFPDYSIGIHCKKPYVCPHFKDCSKDLGTVLHLRRGGKKIYEFIDEGVINITDIQDVSRLSVFQLKQYESEKTQSPVVERDRLKEFLGKIEFPCSLLDFEGFSSPIVHRLGLIHLRPYSQIVFQADLKVARSFGDQGLQESGVIADRCRDPRKQVADFLFQNVPDEGSVVVYFKNYEVSRIEELGELFPEYRSKFNSIINRIVDLEEIFSRGIYVDYRFQGSSSVKKVLGVVCPEFSTAYRDLPLVNNGQLASIKYLEYFKGMLTANQESELMKSLREYCSLDVISMWKIIQQLRRICEK